MCDKDLSNDQLKKLLLINKQLIVQVDRKDVGI
jgi:hypothetical protein